MFNALDWQSQIEAVVRRSLRPGKDDLRQDLWVAVLEKHYGRVSEVRRAALVFAYYGGYRDGMHRASPNA